MFYLLLLTPKIFKYPSPNAVHNVFPFPPMTQMPVGACHLEPDQHYICCPVASLAQSPTRSGGNVLGQHRISKPLSRLWEGADISTRGTMHTTLTGFAGQAGHM